jgi:hypothetical protein
MPRDIAIQFVLRFVVRGLVVDLRDVFDLLSPGRDEQHACPGTLKVEGTTEVHYPVFKPLLGRGHLPSTLTQNS